MPESSLFTRKPLQVSSATKSFSRMHNRADMRPSDERDPKVGPDLMSHDRRRFGTQCTTVDLFHMVFAVPCHRRQISGQDKLMSLPAFGCATLSCDGCLDSRPSAVCQMV